MDLNNEKNEFSSKTIEFAVTIKEITSAIYHSVSLVSYLHDKTERTFMHHTWLRLINSLSKKDKILKKSKILENFGEPFLTGTGWLPASSTEWPFLNDFEFSGQQI